MSATESFSIRTATTDFGIGGKRSTGKVVRPLFLSYFTFGKLRLLHQSTGGFIEDNLTSLQPDLALLYPMERNDLAEMLKALQPKTVFVHHFDRWGLPFADGLPEEIMGRTRRFAREVVAIDKNIKVVIRKYFETYSLD